MIIYWYSVKNRWEFFSVKILCFHSKVLVSLSYISEATFRFTRKIPGMLTMLRVKGSKSRMYVIGFRLSLKTILGTMAHLRDLIPCKVFYYIRHLYSWITNHPQISNNHHFNFYADTNSMTIYTTILYVMV